MQFLLSERGVPAKTRFGNAAWLLIHSSPYQVYTFDEPKQFAAKYLALVEGILGAYPCAECRETADTSAPVLAARQQLRDFVDGLSEDADANEVADGLAIAASRLHAAVTAEVSNRQPDQTVKKWSTIMCDLIAAVDEGRVPKRFLASILRIRWS